MNENVSTNFFIFEYSYDVWYCRPINNGHYFEATMVAVILKFDYMKN